MSEPQIPPPLPTLGAPEWHELGPGPVIHEGEPEAPWFRRVRGAFEQLQAAYEIGFAREAEAVDEILTDVRAMEKRVTETLTELLRIQDVGTKDLQQKTAAIAVAGDEAHRLMQQDLDRLSARVDTAQRGAADARTDANNATAAIVEHARGHNRPDADPIT